MAFSLTAGVVPAVAMPTSQATAPAAAPKANLGISVTGLTPVGHKGVKVSDATGSSYTPSAASSTWPKAASGSAALSAPLATGLSQDSAVTPLASGSSGAAGAKAQAAGTPVWAQAVAGKQGSYGGPKSVDVAVQSKSLAAQLGLSGVVFSVAGAGGSGSGSVRVGLDYASFAQAIGGNYATRLRLVQLPACALTTPQLAKCRVQTPLSSLNSEASSSVSALVTLAGSTASGTSANSPATDSTATYSTATGKAVVKDASSPSSGATVLGATDSTGQEGGEGGTYASDSLSSAGSWAQSGSSGDYTYTYTVTTPASSSSLTPNVSLSYDSGSVNGKTSNTQAQSSWVGDGWATQDSYVEQTFTPCDDDPEGSAGSITTTDECYDGQLLTLSLNGSSTSIVDDNGTYTLANDDGAVVTLVTGANNGTGTYNTDYWKITERDGTSYYFGLNQLPGYAAGDAVTNSVDYEPVYSAHVGDPCYNVTPADSVCTMAAKWHLDYVVDAKSEAMAYYYTQATNYYGENSGATNVAYIRDSYLAHIDYGFSTATGAYGTVPDKVVYTTGVRCVSGATDCGSAENSSNESYYPDVPFDLVCASGATCSVDAPSFFSTAALTTITTEQYSVSTSSYANIDSYALTQTTPSTGDATSATLWLSSIQRTAFDVSAGGTTAITQPPVTFAGTGLENRVDTATYPGMTRYRLTSITTELGAVIGITYGLPQACSDSYVTGQNAANAYQNTESCFPVYWTPAGDSAPVLDWFNQYAVTQVLETDTTGGNTTQESDYSYTGAAWHYDDDPTVKAKYRTWGEWRGYQTVTTTTGNGTDPKTENTTSYYQGMNGDYLTSTTTSSVSLTDSQGGSHVDYDQLSGDVLESESYLGYGGPPDSFTIDSYWVSGAIGTQAITGLPALTSNVTGPAESYKGQHLTDGNTSTWRYNETDTSYDATGTDSNFGLPLYAYSHTYPINTAYDRCTTTTYTPANTSLNIVGLAGMTETDAVACSGFTEGANGTTPEPSQPAATLNTLGAPSSLTRPADVVSASETLYDGASTITAVPTVGLGTENLTATGYSSGAWVWRVKDIVGYTSAAAFSRPHTSTDGRNYTTTTSYTLNSANLTTGISTENALNQITSETLDPTRALVLTATDANGIVTTKQYDALGRVTSEWDDSRATNTPANALTAYTMSDTTISGTVTQKLNAESGYNTYVTIEDSLGRTRQTQSPTPQGGRLITDTLYDSRGLVSYTNVAYWDSTTTPTLALDAVPSNEVPDQEDYVYDGLGRQVQGVSENDAAVISTSYTVYNGDCTTSIPPTGGVWKSTCTDPLGRTSTVAEYSADPTLTVPSNVATSPQYLTGGTAVTTTTGYGFDTTSTDATYGDTYTTTTDALGDIWYTYQDLAGDTMKKVDPSAGTSTVTYDADGNALTSTDADGNTLSYVYDALDRKTAEYDSATQDAATEMYAWVYDNSNNAVTAMTDPIGHVTTETTYQDAGAQTYVVQQTGFNAFGESLGTTTTVNSTAQGTVLGKAWTITHTYSAINGLPGNDTYPSGGGIASEIVVHGYETSLDLPDGLATTSYGYAQQVVYDAWSRPLQEQIGSSGSYAWVTNTYDPHTGRLTETLVTRSTTTPTNVDQINYTYDLSGNTTKKVEERLGSTSDEETQCYLYDSLDRLTTAWSATDACATAPTTSSFAQVGNTLGDGSAYWESWTYNAIGNRLTQDQHSLTSSADDTITTSTYDTTRTSLLDSTSTKVNGAVTATTSYTYDPDGNTATRDTAVGNQTLTWNADGTLAGDNNTTKTQATTYLYDADGNLLIQADPATTVLYLGYEQITLNDAAKTTTGVRYYPLPGGGTTVRTGLTTNYDFELTDQQGTSDLYLNNTAQNPTWREYDPYGNQRGTTAVTWVDNRTLMDKPTDTTTDLTNDGARYLDTTIARFITLDPLFEATDTLALGGYAYTDDNPITGDDPTGQQPSIHAGDCVGSAQYCEGAGSNAGAGDNATCGDPGFVGPCAGGGSSTGTSSGGTTTTTKGTASSSNDGHKSSSALPPPRGCGWICNTIVVAGVGVAARYLCKGFAESGPEAVAGCGAVIGGLTNITVYLIEDAGTSGWSLTSALEQFMEGAISGMVGALTGPGGLSRTAVAEGTSSLLGLIGKPLVSLVSSTLGGEAADALSDIFGDAQYALWKWGESGDDD